MQSSWAGLFLCAAACGGDFATLDADAGDAALGSASCEAGAAECLGPVETCGRRTRTCGDDGTWSEWTCAITSCVPAFCAAPPVGTYACSDSRADCDACPTTCTIADADGGVAVGSCH
jgi:hypothetical protein